MRRFSWWLIALPLASSLGVLGCALTDKADAWNVHYYAAEAASRGSAQPVAAVSAAVPGADQPAAAKVLLRLGRVSAGAHLGKKIVYRTSSVEVGIYDERRWTERPEEYLRRALSSSLFDERGLTQSLAGASATLDLELLAFEEIRTGEQRSGRVQIRFSLHDEREVLLSDVVTIDKNASSAEPEVLVRAISAALGEASTQIADRVASRLAEARTTPEG